jgi:ribulose-5-phosphate 4-epimerase/fuculose-1-phosphate aldolase
MKFAVVKNRFHQPLRDRITRDLTRTFLKHGHQQTGIENGINFVFNLTDFQNPCIFCRKSKAVFVISIVEVPAIDDSLRSNCYRALVRSLSNLLIAVSPALPSDVYFTTPEAGFYRVALEEETIYKRILPIAGAHVAMDNRIITDLPQAYWKTSPVIEQIKKYGKILDEMGILPTPFPLHAILSPEDIDHLYRLFQVKGLSYGNLSARERISGFDFHTFWMTARGVDKSNLQAPGRDLLLVTGIEEESGKIQISVPPQYDPKVRVSVDAVEHELIYRTFPGVGAVVHVHAWMDGIKCTRQNYPCGTLELAAEVVNLLKKESRPERSIVGLKNHGLTLTGHNLDEIFDHMTGRIRTEVPMFA